MKKILLSILIFLGACTVKGQIVKEGMVAKYYFNKGNANNDIGNHHGSVTGAVLVPDRFGNQGKAYYLDGIDDHLDFGDHPEFRMGKSDFSISIWVKYTDPQEANLISKRDGANTNYNMYSLLIMTDAKAGGVNENFWTFLRSNTSLDRQVNVGSLMGYWHHIVLSHTYADNTTLYVDGQLAGSDKHVQTGEYNVAGRPLVIGYSEESNTHFYKGLVDDVRIYRRALNKIEADSLFREKDPSVGIDERDNVELVSAYPNPTTDKVQLSKICDWSVSDITGRIILEKQKSDLIELSNEAQGMYLLSIYDDRRRLIQVNKLIKE